MCRLRGVKKGSAAGVNGGGIPVLGMGRNAKAKSKAEAGPRLRQDI